MKKQNETFNACILTGILQQSAEFFFPFSVASKVKLISFGATRLPDPEYDSKGNLIEYVPEKGGPLITP